MLPPLTHTELRTWTLQGVLSLIGWDMELSPYTDKTGYFMAKRWNDGMLDVYVPQADIGFHEVLFEHIRLSGFNPIPRLFGCHALVEVNGNSVWFTRQRFKGDATYCYSLLMAALAAPAIAGVVLRPPFRAVWC